MAKFTKICCLMVLFLVVTCNVEEPLPFGIAVRKGGPCELQKSHRPDYLRTNETPKTSKTTAWDDSRCTQKGCFWSETSQNFKCILNVSWTKPNRTNNALNQPCYRLCAENKLDAVWKALEHTEARLSIIAFFLAIYQLLAVKVIRRLRRGQPTLQYLCQEVLLWTDLWWMLLATMVMRLDFRKLYYKSLGRLKGPKFATPLPAKLETILGSLLLATPIQSYLVQSVACLDRIFRLHPRTVMWLKKPFYLKRLMQGLAVAFLLPIPLGQMLTSIRWSRWEVIVHRTPHAVFLDGLAFEAIDKVSPDTKEMRFGEAYHGRLFCQSEDCVRFVPLFLVSILLLILLTMLLIRVYHRARTTALNKHAWITSTSEQTLVIVCLFDNTVSLIAVVFTIAHVVCEIQTGSDNKHRGFCVLLLKNFAYPLFAVQMVQNPLALFILSRSMREAAKEVITCS